MILPWMLLVIGGLKTFSAAAQVRTAEPSGASGVALQDLG